VRATGQNGARRPSGVPFLWVTFLDRILSLRRQIAGITYSQTITMEFFYGRQTPPTQLCPPELLNLNPTFPPAP